VHRVLYDLRKNVTGEAFDYQVLLDALRGYERPRDRITELLKRKEIVRVKKGIYVFGEKHAGGAVAREVLANMLYGPSYISLDYALHYYGMIPERVVALTSVTVKRSRKFSTPLGLFTYREIPLRAYPIGIDQVDVPAGGAFLIAVPEKALCDKIDQDRGTAVRTRAEMRAYLTESLRIDPEELRKLRLEFVEQVAELYRSRKMRLLGTVLRQLCGAARP
jgi:hypothetical protein